MLINSKRELVIDIIIIIVVIVIGFLAFKNSFAIEPGRKITIKTYYEGGGDDPCDIKVDFVVDENEVADFLKNQNSNLSASEYFINDPTQDGTLVGRDNYAPRETESDRKEREAMEKLGYYKDGSGVWVKPKLGPDGSVQLGYASREKKKAEKGQILWRQDGTSYEAQEGDEYYETEQARYSKKRKIKADDNGSYDTVSGKEMRDSITYNKDGTVHSILWARHAKVGHVTSYEIRTHGYSQNGGPCDYSQTLTGGNQRGKVSNTGGYTYDYNDESDYETDPITGKPKVDINGNLILKSKLGPKDAVTPDDEQLSLFDLKKQIFDANDVANDGTDNGTILAEYAVPLGFSGAVQKLGVKNNDDVRLAQLVLYIDGISKGAPSRLINGNLSGITQRSIMQFQKKNDLGATGLLDTPTQDLMQFYVDELIAGPEFEDESVEEPEQS